MKASLELTRAIEITLLAVMFTCAANAQALLAELKAEHDPGRRAEKALALADSAFDNARDDYKRGDVDKGNAELENMTTALNECVASVGLTRKAKFYKRAEMKVAYLQRRLDGVVDDIDVQQRGWAAQTQRKVEEIHEKLLSGVMSR